MPPTVRCILSDLLKCMFDGPPPWLRSKASTCNVADTGDEGEKGQLAPVFIPAWEIPWTEKLGGLQSMNWTRDTHTHTHTLGGWAGRCYELGWAVHF